MDKRKNKIILMYPGQGSQYTGMGLEYYDSLEGFSKYFNMASGIIGEDIADIIFNKNEAGFKLENTLYSQISIYAMSASINDYLFKNCFLKRESVLAVTGHSLGDYSALYASGYFNFEVGLKLVKYRGELMSEANENMDGMMAAILGVDINMLENNLFDFKKKYNLEVYVANYNDYTQIVISGTRSNMEKAQEFLKENGVRKIIPLKVKIASHTPLMKEVSLKLGEYIKGMKLNDPSINFYSSTSLSYPGRKDIGIVLENQLTNRINWVPEIEYFLNEGADVFVEIGPGKVLSGLVKRISEKNQKDVMIFNTDKLSDLNNLKDFLN